MAQEIRELYEGMKARLDGVDFSAIWEGFHRYPFALYNDESVWLDGEVIPRDNRFLGNTCIEYGGGRIAIWNIGYGIDGDADIFASSLVHEMFHAFQMENSETRFPNDLVTLDYPMDVMNFSVKLEENRLLAEACRGGGQKRGRDLLRRFAGLRLYRESIIGGSIDCECLTETVEGMAEYAGILALNQLSGKKFDERLEKYLSIIEFPGELLFDPRRISYYTGALVVLAAKLAGISLSHGLGAERRSVFRILAGALDAKAQSPDPSSFPDGGISQLFSDFRAARAAIFDGFMGVRREKTSGSYTICGYDPMNMIKSEGKVLCKNFIMLKEDGNEEARFIGGPVLLELEENSVNRVKAYYK